MAKTVSSEKRDRTRPWQRAATRAAILEAARRLIARNGIDNLSLTAVAREADFAPATVFAYFATKNDLFLAALADDLASFARSMQTTAEAEQDNSEQFPGGGVDTGAQEKHAIDEASVARASDANRLRLVESLESDIDAFGCDVELASQQDIVEHLIQEFERSDSGIDAFAANADEPAPQRDVAELLLNELNISSSDDPVREPPPSAPARAMPADAGEDVARLREAIARLEARPVDQWLERRLREFERGLAALEQRSERNEFGPALAALDESLHHLSTRLDAVESRQAKDVESLSRSMRERADLAEQRFRDTMSDVEAANARNNTRLDALENAAFAVAPEYFQSHTTSAAKQEPAAVVAPRSDPNEAAEGASEPAPADPVDGRAYLSAARRSAMAAVEQTATEDTRRPRARKRNKRTLYLVAGVLALAAALMWIGVLFKAHAVPAQKIAAARVVQVASLQNGIPVSHAVSRLVAEARAGDARAATLLALNLLDGRQKSRPMGARWLTFAAQRGDAFAAYKLAMLYRSGHAVAADPAQAFHWFRTAALEGNRGAMQDLAVAYAEGWGTDKNAQEAARWFTRAAALGLTDAQFDLGVLYERGLGVPQSLPDAYRWYLIAAGAGDREAEARVDALKPQLDSSDIAAAEEDAASFKPAPLNQDANVAPSAVQTPAG
ncbi:MAG: TetR family transcriptional regulator [Rhizomicrobium sp.]|jgi:TPR repeat protein